MDWKQELIEELKKEGLSIGEDLAEAIVKVSFRMLPKVFANSTNKYDDLLIPLLAVVEPIVLKELDKIDGQEG